jgi:hypothetical protein
MSEVFDQSSFFGNGSTVRSVKFPLPGDSIRGVICEPPRLEQERDIKTGVPLTWPSGDPKMQMVITLQTTLAEDDDDDGRRRLYVNKKGMKAALADALRAARCNAYAEEGELYAVFTNYGEPSPGLSAPKLFAAEYEPPFNTEDGFGAVGTAELGETATDGIPF